MSDKTEGYVLVASNKINFYRYAINLAESILDFYPDAKITLFCEEWMFEELHRDLFDNVEWCTGHYRAKLEGMARSPYDLTMYLDVDMEVEHEDISTCFQILRDSEHDMLFSALTDDRSYVYAERDFDTPEGKAKFTLCGGICLYDMSVPLIKEFVAEWEDLTKRQMDKEWWPEGYIDSLQSWDQFSLWWLTEKEDKYKDLNYGIIYDDLRWNYYNAFNWHKTKPESGPVIVRHYSCGLDKDGHIL